MDIACKLQTPKTSKRNANNNPWITQSIINAVREKQKLYVKWKNTCTEKTLDKTKTNENELIMDN